MYEIEDKPTNRAAYFDVAQSNAYYKTRYSREGVTIHWWGGGESANQHDNIVNYFLKQGDAQVKSVNFVVSDIKITRMVPEDMVAWCSQGGNPTTISIECQPTLSDEGYKRLAWLISTLNKKYGRTLTIYPHKYWISTDCPGTIDLERIRRDSSTPVTSTIPTAPVQTVSATPKPSPSKQTVYLPSNVDTWAAYSVGSGYRKGTSDQVGTLLPSKFGGLTYPIVQNLGDVVVIDTQSYGRVAIWVKDTSARITSGAVSAQPVESTGTVTFPANVNSWAVYKVGSGYRKGTSDQLGSLAPSRFGGLTYPIVQKLGDVVVIDTQDFGRVAAWVKDTDAVIK